MSAPLLVFDLDGTLVDTAPDLVATLNVVFTRESLSPLPYDTARKLIGGGVRAMIVRGMEAEGRVVNPELIERLFGEFLEHYSAHIADRSRPFPGVIEARDALAARGHRFAVCTNKLESLSLLLLRELSLVDRFAVICGQDTFGIQKPDPEILRRTIAAAGGDPDAAIMIGDSATDIRTAQGAGVPVIAVDFGYSEKPVGTFGPDRIISRFADLPDSVASLVSA
jgi:phosphoglycolate phosphatase